VHAGRTSALEVTACGGERPGRSDADGVESVRTTCRHQVGDAGNTPGRANDGHGHRAIVPATRSPGNPGTVVNAGR
jgi:hypothetical protein